MRQRSWPGKLLALASIVSAGCDSTVPPAEDEEQPPAAVLQAAVAEPEELRLTAEQIATLYGTPDAARTVFEPERVEAYRLVAGEPKDKVADFAIASGPELLARSLAGEFSAALTDPDTFWWDTAKGCEPRYGVRLKFTRGESVVDVLLCLECRSLAVYVADDRPRYKDFDGAAPRLIGLAKQLFPQDAAIQGLP